MTPRSPPSAVSAAPGDTPAGGSSPPRASASHGATGAAEPTGAADDAYNPGAEDVRAAAWAYIGIVVLLVLVGTLLLRSSAAMVGGNRLSLDRALFHAASSTTLTGFSHAIGIDGMRPPGQATILALVMLSAITTLALTGLLVARLASVNVSLSQTAAWAVGVVLGGAAFVGAALAASGMPLRQALFDGIMASGGLPTGLSSPSHRLILLAMLPVALASSLGVVVLMGLAGKARQHRSLQHYTRNTLALVSGAFLVLSCVFMIARVPMPAAELPGDASAAASSALATLTTARPIESPADWPRPVQWIVMAALLAGCAPGGTTGGVSIVACGIIAVGVINLLRDRPLPRLFPAALLLCIAIVALTAITHLALLATQSQLPADRALMLAVSAVTCAGLTHDPLSLNGVGLHTLTAAMLLGRFVPVIILAWAVGRTQPTQG